MIQYFQHSQINKEKWDECIDKSINASVYVLSWYLDEVCKNWSALILNDYEAVFPLAMNTKFKINYLYQPFFTRYFGIFAKTVISEELVSEFFDAIPGNVKFIEFSIHESNKFKREDFQIKERLFQVLNINTLYENIYQGYKGDARRNLKKAEKNQLKIIENVVSHKIVTLFKNNKGRQLKELRSNDYTILENVMNASNKHKCGVSLGVENVNNELIAAAFFILSGNTVLFLKGSANAEGKSAGAMYLIIDTMLKTFAQKKDFFDFGGSSIENIAGFNHNFGAENCVYLQLKKNNLPFIIKQISGKI